MANLILICVDSLRRDRLSYYGYPLKTTPYLDKYFADSYKFNAISPSTWTPTVIASILSSLYPWEHNVLRVRANQLAERYNVYSSGLLLFKDYYKICITSNPWLHPIFNIPKDFDDVKFVSNSWYAEDLNKILSNTLMELKRDNNLLFLHYMDVHEPYDTTFKNKVDVNLLSEIHKSDLNENLIISRGEHQWTLIDEYVNYISSILKADYHIYEALKMLEQTGILKDSLIVLFSDHGEDLRDHGRTTFPRHGHSLYNELIAVPLIIKTNSSIEFDSRAYIEMRMLFYFLHDIIEGVNLHKYKTDEIFTYVALGEEMGSLIDNNSGMKYIYNFNSKTSELYEFRKDWFEKENLANHLDSSLFHNRLEEKLSKFKRRRVDRPVKKYIKGENIDLSIIIVNFNMRGDLESCLHSIYDIIEKINCEIIVVDNNSTDYSVRMIEHNFPGVRIIKNQENVGFAKANNQGIQISYGKYILILHPDTIVSSDSLENMIHYARNNPECGAIGGIYLYPDRTRQQYYNRLLTPASLLLCFTSIGRKIDDIILNYKASDYFYARNLDFSKVVELNQIGTICILMPKTILEKINLFDDKFWGYFSDSDLCKRIFDAGYKIHVLPDSKIIHNDHCSSKKIILKDIHNLFNKGFYYYVKKHFGIMAALTIKLFIWLGIIKTTCESIINYRRKLDGNYLSQIDKKHRTNQLSLMDDFSAEHNYESFDTSNTEEECNKIKEKLEKLGYL